MLILLKPETEMATINNSQSHQIEDEKQKNNAQSTPSAPQSWRTRLNKSNFWTFFWFQSAIFVLYVLFAEYSDEANGTSPVADDSMVEVYPLFQDIHIMMFIGFGFLMTFLRKYGYSSITFNFVVAALSIQWGMLTVLFFRQALHASAADLIHKVMFDIHSLIEGDFAAATVLISMGGVLGKVSLSQLVWMVFFELILYAVNLEIVYGFLQATDVGGSMVIHTFGAYFGLAACRFITQRDIEQKDRDKDNKAVYHSDLFSMIGTIFLWCFWPSFNAALAVHATNAKHRVVLNTVLSLAGSCIGTVMIAPVFRAHGKLDMVDIQNATLAGGVAMGASADLMLEPWGAVLLGVTAGFVSSFGFSFMPAILHKKFGIHDTCGIHNLHGMPGLLGGIASAVAVAIIPDSKYTDVSTVVFGRETRSALLQGGYQLAALSVSLAIAIVGGSFTGMFLNSRLFSKPKNLFDDSEEFETPHEEIPTYFQAN